MRCRYFDSIRGIVPRTILPVVLGASLAGCGVLGPDDVLGPRCGPVDFSAEPPAPLKEPSVELRVYLLRGLYNYYSLGLEELNDQLTLSGLDSRLVDWPNWETSGEGIVSETASGGTPGDLVIIGHSFGADDAVLLSKYLGERGVDVKLLILLDATLPPPIPANVERCIHYYIPTFFGDTWPNSFAGNPVVPEDGNSRTHIENRYARDEDLGDGEGCINHFNIEAVGTMQRIVMRDIAELGVKPAQRAR